MPVKALLPFGSWGYARVKYWNDRTTDFQRTKVQILGPDASMTEGVLCPDRSWKVPAYRRCADLAGNAFGRWTSAAW